MHVQDCDYPWGIENVKIEKRRIPLTDNWAQASFSLNKVNIKDWLLDSDFEVLIYSKDNELDFVTQKVMIPLYILEGEIDFTIQFLHTDYERTVVSVDCSRDSVNSYVSLIYNPT